MRRYWGAWGAWHARLVVAPVPACRVAVLLPLPHPAATRVLHVLRLQAPFCVHPKTGKVCVPLDPEKAHLFDPEDVPTVHTLLDQLPAAMQGNTQRVRAACARAGGAVAAAGTLACVHT